jgi:hypothetical protein
MTPMTGSGWKSGPRYAWRAGDPGLGGRRRLPSREDLPEGLAGLARRNATFVRRRVTVTMPLR